MSSSRSVLLDQPGGYLKLELKGVCIDKADVKGFRWRRREDNGEDGTASRLIKMLVVPNLCESVKGETLRSIQPTPYGPSRPSVWIQYHLFLQLSPGYHYRHQTAWPGTGLRLTDTGIWLWLSLLGPSGEWRRWSTWSTDLLRRLCSTLGCGFAAPYGPGLMERGTGL